ncbi:MAG: asparaginase domain-containing protein, partial [archaeon]|nr:asparaginase domain-containing protein [archaeon]
AKCQGRGLAPQPLDKSVKNYLKKKYASVNLEFEELELIDSGNMEPKYWAYLANYVQAMRTLYSAVVIFHGTDTMAYTAAALFLLLQAIDIPVVLVGSQKPIYSFFTDAYKNIKTAMLMAMSKYPGVFVAFNKKILPGMACSKIDSEKDDAFSPINTEIVAEQQKNDKLVFTDKYKKFPILPPYVKRTFTGDEFNENFHCFNLSPGAKINIMKLASMFKILVIRSYGAGGLPKKLVDKIAEAQKKYNTIIGIATQCTYGGVNLNIYETGKTTKEKINLISAKKDALEYFTLKLRYKYNEENQNCFN